MEKPTSTTTMATIVALVLGGGGGGTLMDFQASKRLKIELSAKAKEHKAELAQHRYTLDIMAKQHTYAIQIIADACRN